MSSSKPTLSILSFLLLAIPSALASETIMGAGSKLGPYDMASAKFDEFMKTPNATSRYPIEAPYTTLHYRVGGPAMPGWGWTISVAADIPLSEAGSNLISDDKDIKNKTFTGVKVVAEAPVELNGTLIPIDETWGICIINWSINTTSSGFPAKLRTDDGTCSSVLGEQCQRAVEAGAVQQYKRENTYSMCGCPDLEKLGSSGCSADEVNILKSGWGCVSRHFNSTEVSKWPSGKYDLIQHGGIPHARGNLTGYDQAGSLAWPVLILFGPSKKATNTSDGFENPVLVPDTAAKLSCLRAKDATPGSFVPGSAGTSSGRRIRESLASGTLAAVAVFVGVSLVF